MPCCRVPPDIFDGCCQRRGHGEPDSYLVMAISTPSKGAAIGFRGVAHSRVNSHNAGYTERGPG